MVDSESDDGDENLDTEEFVSRNEKVGYATKYHSIEKR